MARAIGDPRRSRARSDAVSSEAVTELVAGLEALAMVNEETRSAVFTALGSGDDPDYASAYESLFAAVAKLDPDRAGRTVSDLLAKWSAA